MCKLRKAGKDAAQDPQSYLVLAKPRCQLNQPEEAHAALAKGVEILQTKLPQLDNGDLGGAWAPPLMPHILLREAGALSEKK